MPLVETLANPAFVSTGARSGCYFRSMLRHSLLIAATLPFLSLVIVSHGASAGAAASPPSFPAYKHPVMTWIPPYAVPKCRARLAESFDGTDVSDGLTHLGLQFWTPTPSGEIAYAGKNGPSDAAVGEFVRWGHEHGIRVLLCVYNGAHSWDWKLARAGFAEHPATFIQALINEADRLNLDGVDIDLEGDGSFEPDKEPFIKFIADLSTQLHSRGKHLTVDTFSHVWNAPNSGWWDQLFPLVDGLTTMGYESLGLKGSDWRSYAGQKSDAGSSANKLMLGMPAHKDTWQGNTTLEQLEWVVRDGGVGVSLWDAQLEAASWTKPETWKALEKIRGRE